MEPAMCTAPGYLDTGLRVILRLQGRYSSWLEGATYAAQTPGREERLAPFHFQRRHRRIVPPVSPEARIVPSGENARAMTRPAWPTSVHRFRPVAGSHSLMVL